MTIAKESIADTIEGLEQLANRGIQSVHIDMAIAGLRRLLAVEAQEPVAMRWRFKDDGMNEVGDWIYHASKYFEQLNASDTRLCELLYAAPQPAPVAQPAPVLVPEEYSEDQWWYKKLLEVLPNPQGDLDLKRAIIGVVPRMIRELNACRAAMLQGKAETQPAPMGSAMDWFNRETNDQIAAVMLQHGTPEQQENALRYAGATQTETDGSQRHEAEHVASILEFIGSFEAADIDSDTVDLRFELDGVDTGADASITEYAARGAAVIKQLLNQAPVKQPSSKPKSELLQRAEKLAEDTAALAQRLHCEDIRAKVRVEHAEWAMKTFGNTGPVGPLKHLSKEALEAAEAPEDLHEWADMQFLFWDAQRKAGVSDEQITAAMVEKLEINKARQWPEPKDGEPRFHIKGQ